MSLLYRFSYRLLMLLVMVSLAATTVAGPADLQLADNYRQGMSLEGYWVSEKLDGVRARWDGHALYSRGGYRIAAPDWFTRGFPPQPLDGELWMGRGTFSAVSAAVRRLEPDMAEWRKIRFMIFDLPASQAPFSERIDAMKQLVQDSSSYTLSMIEQQPATSHVALMHQLDKVTARGGEGLMLHHGESLYHDGRSQALLKVKTWEDAEAWVVAHREGKGKYQGMLGALVVKTPDGRRFKLGSGFSDEERANPPPVGSRVTYKYYGLTTNGLPRFASFLRIRPGFADNNTVAMD
ncbi:DNA ligase [Alcanivorax sp. DP30]|uniref:DNA ligase n=1 Tax=Alcanivorax sp. DP30 TaxID=2606217 RepID=UPI00351B49FA